MSGVRFGSSDGPAKNPACIQNPSVHFQQNVSVQHEPSPALRERKAAGVEFGQLGGSEGGSIFNSSNSGSNSDSNSISQEVRFREPAPEEHHRSSVREQIVARKGTGVPRGVEGIVCGNETGVHFELEQQNHSTTQDRLNSRKGTGFIPQNIQISEFSGAQLQAQPDRDSEYVEDDSRGPGPWDWIQLQHPERNFTYYLNQRSNETSWTPPKGWDPNGSKLRKMSHFPAAAVAAESSPKKVSVVALDHVKSLKERVQKCPVNSKSGGTGSLKDRMSIYDLQKEDFEMLQHLESANDIKIMI